MKKKQLVILDIESMEQPLWLHNVQERFTEGFSTGQLSVIAAGRGAGKSMFWSEYMKTHNMFTGKPIKDLTTAVVDGQLWHTVECNREPATWVRTQQKEQWYEHTATKWPFTTFDVSDKLYTFMRIKFSA